MSSVRHPPLYSISFIINVISLAVFFLISFVINAVTLAVFLLLGFVIKTKLSLLSC